MIHLFKANTDMDTTVTNYLDPTFAAKYIKLHPLSWNEWIAMRWDIYGCTGFSNCINTLLKHLFQYKLIATLKLTFTMRTLYV